MADTHNTICGIETQIKSKYYVPTYCVKVPFVPLYVVIFIGISNNLN